MKQYQLLEIHWDDSETIFDGAWTDVEEIIKYYDEDKAHPIKTVGYFLHRTHRYLIIYRTKQTNEDGEVDRVEGQFAIPNGCIRTIRKML